jgi:hypothetical protein
LIIYKNKIIYSKKFKTKIVSLSRLDLGGWAKYCIGYKEVSGQAMAPENSRI